MTLQPQIIEALLLIIFVAVLPVLAWKKSRSMCLPVIGLYGVFIYLYLDFILGKVTVYHDTYWNIAVNFSLIRQWVLGGVSLGWNPYLGGGQPLSLFSNYFLYAPVFIFTKIFLWLGWNFSPGEFFSLIWIFNHLWICTGVYLFFHLWFNSSFFGFLGAGTMLLGGLFASDLAAPFFYVIGPLPYLLFSIVLFWKFGRWFGLYLFAAFLGITLNYYNPVYTVSFLFILLVCYLLMNRFAMKFIFYRLLSFIKAKPYGLVLAALLFIVPAAPFFHTYFEMGDYVSPTRGFTLRGQTVSNTGAQGSTDVPFESLRVMSDGNIQDMFLTTHTFFYIGILSYAALFLSVPLFLISPKFRARAGFLILSASLLALMAMGQSSPVPLWKLLQNIPIFHMIRHTFGYAKMVTFLVIIIGLEGIRATIYPLDLSLYSKISNRHLKKFLYQLPWIMLGFIIFKKVGNINLIGLEAFYFPVVIFALIAWWAATLHYFPKKIIPIAFLLLIGVHSLELILFSHDRVKILPGLSEISPEPFKYSSKWSLYGIKSSTNVFDLDPMLQKEAVWFHRNPSYVLMINRDFIPFLRAATQEDLYQIGKRHPKDILLPKDLNNGDALAALYKELGFTKKITYAPLYATPETNYPVPHFHDIYGAINGKYNFYWEVDKKANEDPYTWLSITFPAEITVYGIRITPYKATDLWRGEQAKMQVSPNGEDWNTVKRLDLRKTDFNGSNRPVLFPLPAPVKAKYFRLWVDGRQFASLAQIELIDEPLGRIKAVQNSPLLPLEKDDTNSGLLRASSFDYVYSGKVLSDRNLDTFLRINDPNDAFTSWISIEFPRPKTFNSILIIPAKEIRFLSYLPGELQISDDGKQWDTVKQLGIDGYNAGYYYLNQKVTARHVRLQLKGVSITGPNAGYSIAELRFAELPEVKAEGSGGIGRVEAQPSADPNRIYLKIHAEKDADLIRMENYNKGWNAYIDNQKVVMQKFGPNLQLIPIRAGDHEVRLEFHSWYNILAWSHVCFVAFIWLLLALYLLFGCFGSGQIAQGADRKMMGKAVTTAGGK